MATIEKAVEIAAKAHAGVKDKQMQCDVLSYRFLNDEIDENAYRDLMSAVST